MGLLLFDSELGDRPLLLDNLDLPGGGGEDGLPSNGDSSSGGRVLRETKDQGVFEFMGFTTKTMSVVPYLIFVLCLISPLRYS